MVCALESFEPFCLGTPSSGTHRADSSAVFLFVLCCYNSEDNVII